MFAPASFGGPFSMGFGPPRLVERALNRVVPASLGGPFSMKFGPPSLSKAGTALLLLEDHLL